MDWLSNMNDTNKKKIYTYCTATETGLDLSQQQWCDDFYWIKLWLETVCARLSVDNNNSRKFSENILLRWREIRSAVRNHLLQQRQWWWWWWLKISQPRLVLYKNDFLLVVLFKVKHKRVPLQSRFFSFLEKTYPAVLQWGARQRQRGYYSDSIYDYVVMCFYIATDQTTYPALLLFDVASL